MDQSLIVAEKYKNQPQLLEQALLGGQNTVTDHYTCLLYTSPSPRDS